MFCFHHCSHISSVVSSFIFILKVSSFGVGLVIMIFYYHVDMFHTHFQIFTNCHTSVVIVVANCVFWAAHEMGCHNVV